MGPMKQAGQREREFHELIVIGGTSRAGTTSLFRMLRALPGTSSWVEKECRFFLPAQVELPSRERYPAPRSAYLARFDGHDAGARLLDATPDYLHYAGCEEALHRYFPSAKIVFVLRDPVERLVSWFRYSRQRGWIDVATSFEGYLELQSDARREPYAATHLLARDHGCYALRLGAFLSRFPADQVHVAFFEELREEPEVFLQKLGRFLGLELSGCSLPHENRSRGPGRGVLAGGRQKLERWTRGTILRRSAGPLLRGALGRIRRFGVQRAQDTAGDEGGALPPDALSRLTGFYAPSVHELTALLGSSPPWPRFGPAADGRPRPGSPA